MSFILATTKKKERKKAWGGGQYHRIYCIFNAAFTEDQSLHKCIHSNTNRVDPSGSNLAPDVQNLFLHLQVFVKVVDDAGLIQAQDEFRFTPELKGTFTMENVLISCRIKYNVVTFVVHRDKNFFNLDPLI